MRAPEARRRVVELCLDLSRRGYFSGTGGNIALRVDAEHFAVTPSATDYFSMNAADVCLLRLADLARIEGERAPSVETGLHASVLRRRPDVLCCIHTHQPVASALSLMGAALTVDDATTRAILGPEVPLICYMPSGTGLLAMLVRRTLRPDCNAYLMRNHGALCCGGSVEAAMQAVEALERMAISRLHHLIAAHAAAEPSQNAPRLQRVMQALA